VALQRCGQYSTQNGWALRTLAIYPEHLQAFLWSTWNKKMADRTHLSARWPEVFSPRLKPCHAIGSLISFEAAEWATTPLVGSMKILIVITCRSRCFRGFSARPHASANSA